MSVGCALWVVRVDVGVGSGNVSGVWECCGLWCDRKVG